MVIDLEVVCAAFYVWYLSTLELKTHIAYLMCSFPLFVLAHILFTLCSALQNHMQQIIPPFKYA